MRKADLLITHARLWSGGALLAGADAVATAGGRMLALGPTTALEDLAGPATRRMDAAGGTVTPGLWDAHLHLVAWARARSELRLEGLRTRHAVLEALAGHCARLPGTAPVIGRGWAADEWEAPPEWAVLDAVAPGRIVLLHGKDYHALWVNGAALERAGVTRATPDPPGGRIERLASGEPSGVIRERAVRLFDSLLPQPSRSDDLERSATAARSLLAEGVTAVHDFEGEHEAAVLRALGGGGGPRVRVLMHVPGTGLDRALAEGIRSGAGDEWFRWGALKLFADGTLGSRTAAMIEPYDGTGERGLDLLPRNELVVLARRARAGGLSVAVHAIGDRAVRHALDAFAAAGEGAGPPAALPPRIEHAQLVHPEDLPRFAALRVWASMQPLHCTSDAPLVERWWKTRAAWSYPWRALLDHGARLAFGSDAPVEEPRVAEGLHAAVTRERRDAPGAPFVPAQRVTLDQALTAFTEGPARLAGLWPQLGRLAPGAAADLVVWSEDLHRIPPARLHQARPLLTVIGGEVAYERAVGGSAAAAAATLRGGGR